MAGDLRNAFDKVATESTLQGVLDALGVDENATALEVLQAIHSAVSNPLEITGLPASYPLPAEQVEALTPSGGGEVEFPAEYPLPPDQVVALAPKEQVDVGNFPTAFPDGHDQPLTDGELRAAPIQTAPLLPEIFPNGHDQPLTDDELRASPLVVGSPQTDRRMEQVAVGSGQRPRYMGSAPAGSASIDPVWRIDRFTWETGPAGDLYPSLIETRIGAWDDRSNLF